jgi:hypothetical protein
VAREYEHAGPHPRSREATRRAAGAPPGLNLHGMSSGAEYAFEVARGSAPGAQVHVRYDAEQSHGDNGSPVRGAYTGRYTVTHNGRTRTFEHGPHATTESARKKGANPNAKSYAAEQARSHILGLA